MGKADTITKQFMSDNQIFADAFNYFVYDGEQVNQPEQLHPLDSAAAD